MIESFTKMPKVELHCHLDGSVSPKLLAELYRQKHGHVPADIAKSFTAPADCTNLTSYLSRFAAICDLLQTPQALEAAAEDVMCQAAAENVIYIEIRFAPMQHLLGGLTPEQVVEAVLLGMEKAGKQYNVHWGVLLCMMIGHEDAPNRTVIELANQYRNKGVVGVDIAGDENLMAASRYAAQFELANSLGIPFTIHAGENGPYQHVEQAIALGAKRIGHGVAIRNNPPSMALCKNSKVLLELCPTSNIQTRAVDSFSAYPFDLFFEQGIDFMLNTDNRTVSKVTLAEEYYNLAQHSRHANYKNLLAQNLTAVDYAFTTKATKQLLRAIINKEIENEI